MSFWHKKESQPSPPRNPEAPIVAYDPKDDSNGEIADWFLENLCPVTRGMFTETSKKLITAYFREAARRLRACRCHESDQPTVREALDAAHKAGGDAWDRVDDPGALIAEYRGEVQPPGIPAKEKSCES